LPPAYELRSLQSRHFLAPADHLLDTLPTSLAGGPALWSSTLVPGDVLRDAQLLQLLRVLRPPVARVLAQRLRPYAVSLPHVLEHADGGLALFVAVGLADLDGHDDVVSILHQHVAGVAEQRGLPAALAVQLRLGVGAALMRLVAALLTLELGPAVGVRRVLGIFVFGPEALEAGHALDQRAVD